jgi:DNA-binding LacI/PurR family transcriptional regulator
VDHATFRIRGQSFIWHAEAAGAQVQTFVADARKKISFPRKSAHDPKAVGELIDRLLAANPRPTAVFTPCDGMAALVYQALAIRGIRVGSGLSVISCNFEPAIISGLHPYLTTININAELIGRCAAQHLSALIGRPRTESCIEIAIEPVLVKGESIAKI